MTDLRKYAADLAGLYERQGLPATPYRLLIEHGEDNTFTPLPEGEEPGQAKGCYQNATQRVLFGQGFEADSDLTYYEGFCFPGLMPIEHAWAQDREGNVYELTLRHNDDRCGFCLGNGSMHPHDHWDHYPSDADEEDFDEAEEIECEQCMGTGKVTRPRDLTGTTYLGIPIDSETLRKIVVATGTYGALFTAPEMVAEAIA